MSETTLLDHEETNGEADTKRRGRPAGARNKPKPARRNYAKELAEMQGRVALAIEVLGEALTDQPGISQAMVKVAIRTLGAERADS